ncbi:hypothetical protein [Corynebacterium pacaense]|uniref:hypothetical protein n=1 Tax=Corynebacterium pacaense TaxID=1816684 RepID=UPI0009BA2798|nr:hypothetical protein [Corynebacterium pacaense]
MAELIITNKNLTVRLRWWEKLGARRSHLTVPRRAIRSIEVVDNAYTLAQLPGRGSLTHIPGAFVAGTRATDLKVPEVRENVFSVCLRNSPGLVIDLENVSIGRIIISTPNAREYASQLSSTS